MGNTKVKLMELKYGQNIIQIRSINDKQNKSFGEREEEEEDDGEIEQEITKKNVKFCAR